MATPAATASSNQLIESLPRAQRGALRAQCESIKVVSGQVLAERNQLIDYVYFPLIGFISLVKHLDQAPALEVGLIGSEGMLGATLSQDVEHAPEHAIVQGGGTLLRMTAAQFGSSLDEVPGLRRVLGRYLYVVAAQLATTAACGRFHKIEHRLARWLLMAHDRAHSDRFALTHEFISNMMGVRRSSISDAAAGLQSQKLIRYTRGVITIVDRARLEAASCACYDSNLDDYRRQLGRRANE